MHQHQGLSVHEMTRSLIIHCHGGGFVAQSSASHQVHISTVCIHHLLTSMSEMKIIIM